MKPRARDLGISFEGTHGPHNAITDVRGVGVGHTILVSGEGKLNVGKGPVRTGVTAILPRGKGLPHFEATVQATEDAIINALIAAETMMGIDGHRVVALPHGPLSDVMKKFNRLNPP
jgi:L-aminopeptidase/D-esterase-like protein